MSNTILQRGKSRVKPHNMRTVQDKKKYMQIVRAADHYIVGEFSQMAVEQIRESNRRLANPAHFLPFEKVNTPKGAGQIIRRWEQRDPWGQGRDGYMYRIELPEHTKVLNDGTRLRMFPEYVNMSEADLIAYQRVNTIQHQPAPVAPTVYALPAPQQPIALLPATAASLRPSSNTIMLNSALTHLEASHV